MVPSVAVLTRADGQANEGQPISRAYQPRWCPAAMRARQVAATSIAVIFLAETPHTIGGMIARKPRQRTPAANAMQDDEATPQHDLGALQPVRHITALAAAIVAVTIAVHIAPAPTSAQESQLGEIFFDIPCQSLVGATPAESQRFAQTAVMAFAGYIAARMPEPVAREMLADFDTLADDFDTRCTAGGGTMRETMDAVIDRYLEGS